MVGQGWEMSSSLNPNERTFKERERDVSRSKPQCMKFIHFGVDGATNELGGVAVMKEVTMGSAKSYHELH